MNASLEKQTDFVINCLYQRIGMLLPSLDSSDSYKLACLIEQDVDEYDNIASIPGIDEKINDVVNNPFTTTKVIVVLDRYFQMILEAMFEHMNEIVAGTFTAITLDQSLTEQQQESLHAFVNQRPYVLHPVKTAL